MEIKFDVYFKKNIGTLCKDNEVDLDGRVANVNIDLRLVDKLEVNYIVGNKKYTDEVIIKDVINKEIIIPFKSVTTKDGLNEFEIVAYMKNGDIKVSQTYSYTVEKGIGEGSDISYIHTHLNKSILDSITEEKINKWDNNINLDLSKYATKEYVNDREIELRASSTHLEWRYKGSYEWINLIALSEIQGESETVSTISKEVITMKNEIEDLKEKIESIYIEYLS
jgi:hypothetical protein